MRIELWKDGRMVSGDDASQIRLCTDEGSLFAPVELVKKMLLDALANAPDLCYVTREAPKSLCRHTWNGGDSSGLASCTKCGVPDWPFQPGDEI